MSGPENQGGKKFIGKDASDKSLHGLSVGLGIAGTIAATVIIFAYAAGEGFSYLSSSSIPAAPSGNTATAEKEPTLPADDVKQELLIVRDKVQDEAKFADEVAIEQQAPPIQQTSEAVEIQESVQISKTDYVPVDEEPNDSSNSAKENDGQDPAPPVNNDENRLTPPLPTLPSLDDKEGEDDEDGADDHHKKGKEKEHEDKKHSHDDSIASIAFKGDKHHKDD